MKKVKFIYNPYSGDGNVQSELDTIISIYQDKNLTIVPFRINEHIPLEKAFFDVDETYAHVLIAGGDGTINNVINCIMALELDIPIAILPTGTANDFAKLIDMPKDIAVACDKITSSEAKYIDLGYLNGKYFVNIFSFGLFTTVSQKTKTPFKNSLGKLAYVLSGIKELQHIKKSKIKLTSDNYSFQGECLICFVFNGKTAGNFKIAYKSEVNDGLLDVIIFKGDNIIEAATILLEVAQGKHLDLNNKGIISFKTKKLSIESEEAIETDIDGEEGPNFPLDIECVENAIKLLY